MTGAGGCTQSLSEGVPHLEDKLRAYVRDNVLEDTLVIEDMSCYNLRNLKGGGEFSERNEMCRLGKNGQ